MIYPEVIVVFKIIKGGSYTRCKKVHEIVLGSWSKVKSNSWERCKYDCMEDLNSITEVGEFGVEKCFSSKQILDGCNYN